MEVITNARKEAGLKNPSTGEYLELDVFIPSLNLAFEFQVSYLIYQPNLTRLFLYAMKERQHYTRDNVFSIIPLAEQQGRDKMKQELTSKNGITLIIVPCWWDRQLER